MESSTRPVLSLNELEAFDPQAQRRPGERRFWCPFCGQGKPKDAAHRSLCVNGANGLWNCKRCGEKGRLREHWPALPPRSKAQITQKRAETALKRAFEIETPCCEAEEENGAWRAIMGRSLVLAGSAGSLVSSSPVQSEARAYLERRGVALENAAFNRVGVVPDWHGRAALTFPFCDLGGEVIALAGRALRDGGMDKPASGPKKRGAFWAATEGFGPLDARLPSTVICEAPLDALSLAQAGFPALALGGTSAPAWLARAGAFRRVALALDADDAGDVASAKIAAWLGSFGARCERLRPEGAKDWNEFLLRHGESDLGCFLAAQLLTG